MSSQIASQAKPVSSSYGQILKSSSIIGGAQGINYLISMIRIKAVAMLLGPSGVGLLGLYTAATTLVATIAGLGLDSSGVREVAEAHGSGDAERIARTIKTLRRVCWATGILGWILTATLSYPISVWTFGSGGRAWAVAILGATLLLNSIASGRNSVIQGTRRIGDLARLNVLGAIVSTLVAVGVYACLGEKGIVPVMIITASINLCFAWWFAKRIQTVSVTQTWSETLRNSKQLVSLGVAFMYGALLSSILNLVIRSLIVRKLGLDANGIYQAAWGISGMFAGFILGAMGTDYYPRLTAIAHDNHQVNRLVNEQIEVGALLALPGLLATLSFAPWLMHFFYSTKFLSGAALLPYAAIGVFGQVLSYPLGFVQRAKGRTGWIFVSQTHVNVLNLVLASVLIPTYGVVAAAWAFALTTYIHGIVVFCIARQISHFAWTAQSARLALSAAGMISIGFASQLFTSGWLEFVLGVVITFLGSLFSLRGITSRLGAEHRIVKMALKFPGGRFACGL